MVFRFALLMVVGGSPSAVAQNRGETPSSVTTPRPDMPSTPAAWQRVDVAPTKTSIYIGSVTMTMPSFVRHGETYSAPYAAKVFPYFFYNESGTLTVDVGDQQLADLAAGKPIEFSGTAVRTDGAGRRVTAKATPSGPRNGKLDVNVYVSKRIKLTFHTTYTFR